MSLWPPQWKGRAPRPRILILTHNWPLLIRKSERKIESVIPANGGEARGQVRSYCLRHPIMSLARCQTEDCVIIVPSFIATVTSGLTDSRHPSDHVSMPLLVNTWDNIKNALILSCILFQQNSRNVLQLNPQHDHYNSLATPSPDSWLGCWWSCYPLSITERISIEGPGSGLSLPAHRHQRADKLVSQLNPGLTDASL